MVFTLPLRPLSTLDTSGICTKQINMNMFTGRSQGRIIYSIKWTEKEKSAIQIKLLRFSLTLFSYEFCKLFWNSYSGAHLWIAASDCKPSVFNIKWNFFCFLGMTLLVQSQQRKSRGNMCYFFEVSNKHGVSIIEFKHMPTGFSVAEIRFGSEIDTWGTPL